MNAKTVNNLHLAFLLAYLGTSLAVADSIAAWPTQLGTRTSVENDIVQALLARHPLAVWIGLPSAVLALHVVTRVGQAISPNRWLLSPRERYVLELPPSESGPIVEDRRRLFAWIGLFATSATVGTSGLMYGLGSLAVSGDDRALGTISRVVGPALVLSLGAFAVGVRYGLRARKRIQAARSL